MILVRYFALTSILCGLLITQAGAAVSFHSVPVNVVAQADQDEGNDSDARDRGVLQGEIVGVDYARGILHLQVPRRGRIDVEILPSTNIVRRGNQYGTIADLAQGVHISVNVSEVGGRLIAQIIRLQ